jgi:hypothetical protein
MSRKKITLPTDRFVSKQAVDKLHGARSAMWGAPHTANKERANKVLAERTIESLRNFVPGALGFKAVADLRAAAGKTRSTTEGLGNLFAETMKRYPKFKKQVANSGYDYLLFDSKGEPVLAKGDRLIGKARYTKSNGNIKLTSKRPFGIGRYRMQLNELLDRAVPEYIEGKMGSHGVSFTRYGADLKIYNQSTGTEQVLKFSEVAKAELISVTGGRKVRLQLKDGSIIEIMVSDLSKPDATEKMFKQIEYWLELKKR